MARNIAMHALNNQQTLIAYKQKLSLARIDDKQATCSAHMIHMQALQCLHCKASVTRALPLARIDGTQHAMHALNNQHTLHTSKSHHIV